MMSVASTQLRVGGERAFAVLMIALSVVILVAVRKDERE